MRKSERREREVPVTLEHLLMVLNDDFTLIARYIYRRHKEIAENTNKKSERELALEYFQLAQYLELRSIALRLKMEAYVKNADHPILKAFDPKNYPDLFKNLDSDSSSDITIEF